MSQSLLDQAAGMMLAAIVATMSGAPGIAKENRRRVMRLAIEHGQSPKRLMRMATDHVAQQLGGAAH